ncbi:MAG: TadE/TadG family type IV pilus assembly protein [Sphingobium sp.]
MAHVGIKPGVPGGAGKAHMGKLAGNTIGFLGRLRKDVRGNVVAMFAAGIFPLLGLVGGAVDISRLYTVKSRLQSACDSGALAGRRVMGTGRWTDNNGRANEVATRTFELNFPAGSVGSGTTTHTFTEHDGTVTGNASVPVPMTLMRVFGTPEKTLTVTCDSLMLIPNTDLMFVLDNSGSMAETIPGDSTGLTKINGLKRAIKCFYEALARQDITDVSPSDCGTSANPTGGLSSQVQLRFGFVNYDNMVNVGKLLPNDFMANNWTYQTRTPNFATVQAWALGSQSAVSWSQWNPSTAPSSYRYASNYGPFSIVSTSGTTTLGGVSIPNRATSASNDSQCHALNAYPGSELVGINEANATSSTAVPSNNNPPVHPTSKQDIANSEAATVTVTGFRYRYFKQGSTNACWLEKATASNIYSKTRDGTSSKPITWTEHQTIANWTYRPFSLNVSALKAGESNWNNTVSLPIGEISGATVKLSGSSTNSTIKLPANISVAWAGCIEERKTVANTDGIPSDDWLSYPSSPVGAFDMNIDRSPDIGDPNTQWGPLLVGAAWGRLQTLNGTSWSGAKTTDPTTGGYTTNRNLSSFTNCVTPSRKLLSYSGNSGEFSPSDFDNYVDTITPNGNTYHDIGLLWGARLMSPTGIFANENATTPGGAQIQRHMIFMTDGATANTYNNYASYGLEWWDRRQVDPGVLSNYDYEKKLEANNNARSNALCTAIKNRNITLWVIYYGTSDTITKTRLTKCATSATYFFEAKSTTTLIAKFREIAGKISNLRLTK